VLGKRSGRHAFKAKLEDLGFSLGDNALNEAFRRFKDLADRKREIYDEDIVALVDDEIAGAGESIRLVHMGVSGSTRDGYTATMEMEIDGKPVKDTVPGNGSVDAVFKALKQVTGMSPHLQHYNVAAVTGGTDAQAEVTVRLEEDGKTVTGQGADIDTIVASARAYVHALNKLIVKRERTAPPAMSA